MIPATQIKVGMVVLHDGKPCRVTNVLHVTPGNWRGMVHAKMINLVTGSQVENRFRSEDPDEACCHVPIYTHCMEIRQ